MPSKKQNAQSTAELLRSWGIDDIVFSPGSRNAPLVIAFASIDDFVLHSHPDERVAAFMAMGMALETQKPVAIACTSGSAVLNYAPAIVEAYYQRIPLVVLTADRPARWIDQGIGQTMRQSHVYANYIETSIDLIGEETKEFDINENIQSLQKALQICWQSQRPVHINIPFEEPLYEIVDESMPHTIVSPPALSHCPESTLPQSFLEDWHRASKVLVLVGQRQKQNGLYSLLRKLAEREDLVLLTESCTNFTHANAVSCIDRTLVTLDEEELEAWKPDLILKLGGAVISKKIKVWLQETASPHWEIQCPPERQDTFGNLRGSIHPATLYANLHVLNPKNKKYSAAWIHRHRSNSQILPAYLRTVPWTDFKAVQILISRLPPNTTFHQANSTSVRYVQLFESRQDITYQSNRGVSGIDGCTSTALGFAMKSQRLHVLLTGDLAFLYDSNALWQEKYPNNLKIIILNNGGGDIFNIIAGPSTTAEKERFFITRHERSLQGIVKGYGLQVLTVHSVEEMQEVLETFLEVNSQWQVMELVTQGAPNSETLKKCFGYLKESRIR